MSYSPWLKKPYQLSTHLRFSVSQYRFVRQFADAVNLTSWQQGLLGLNETQGWLRYGCHQDADQPLIFGAVLMTQQAHQHLRVELEKTGEQPIGEALLFTHPAVRRGKFHFLEVSAQQCPEAFAQLETSNTSLPARYTVCELFGQQFIVLEVFDETKLPPFKAVRGATDCSFRLRQKMCDYWYLIRAHRPLPMLLLLWPVYWALWLASGGFPGWRLLIIFTLGAILMRSAGDIMNDFADRRFDKHIERTQYRPLTTGRVSTKEAVVLAVGLCLAAFGLVLLLNPLSIMMSFGALLLALLYPYAKRVTMLPQLVLGIAYNWGVLMAFAAVQNHIPLIAVVLFVSVILWTIAYDTFYAMADVKDDQQVGIRSSARLFGKHCHVAIGLLQTVAWVLWLIIGIWQQLGVVYYFALLICVPLLYLQHCTARCATIGAYIKAFSDNHWVGLSVALGLVLALH